MPPYQSNPQPVKDAPKPDMEQGGMSEVCVPINSLKRPGEDEQMQNPAEGDVVSLYAEGKVSRIDGDNAYIQVDSVNGKPMNPEAAKTTNNPGMDENRDNDFEQLKTEATGMPMQ
jgi:hypothetical protein